MTTRKDLIKLADRIVRGAAQLREEGSNAREVLNSRGYPDVDATAWAAEKFDAAAAAEQYALGLHDRAAGMDDQTPVDTDVIDQAHKVAQAAELGGILIDSRGSQELSWGQPDAVLSDVDRANKEAGSGPADEKAETVMATGAFEQVADEGQVPFFKLSTQGQAPAEAGPYADGGSSAMAGLPTLAGTTPVEPSAMQAAPAASYEDTAGL